MSGLAPERPQLPPDRTDVLGRRIGAALLDIVLLLVTFVPTSLIAGQAETGHGRFSFNLHGGPLWAWVGFCLLYYFVGEAGWGQTVGKRLLGIRVTNLAGGRPSFGDFVVRTLLRLIDGLPAFYLLGFLVMLASPAGQRIGDRSADTIVIRA